MRRKIPALVALLAFLCAFSVSTGVAQATQTCSDSWGSDGHSGPWYVGSNQSLHGNTLVITCPNGNVAWSIHYWVSKQAQSGGTVYYPINQHQSGTGSTSFNFSTNPIGCNVGWFYWTGVHNNNTGGTINKPTGNGSVIC